MSYRELDIMFYKQKYNNITKSTNTILSQKRTQEAYVTNFTCLWIKKRQNSPKAKESLY